MIPAAALLTERPNAVATDLTEFCAKSFLIFHSESPPSSTISDGI